MGSPTPAENRCESNSLPLGSNAGIGENWISHLRKGSPCVFATSARGQRDRPCAWSSSVALPASAWLRLPKSEKPAAKADAKKPSSYDKNDDEKVQLAAASTRTEPSNKRVLLMFGGDWCGWCHKLHDLFAQNAEIRRLLSYEYELVMIDTNAPHAPELLEECSKGQTGVGFPFLAVMDAGGKLCWSGRRPTRSSKEIITTPRK